MGGCSLWPGGKRLAINGSKGERLSYSLPLRQGDIGEQLFQLFLKYDVNACRSGIPGFLH